MPRATRTPPPKTTPTRTDRAVDTSALGGSASATGSSASRLRDRRSPDSISWLVVGPAIGPDDRAAIGWLTAGLAVRTVLLVAGSVAGLSALESLFVG